MKAFSKDILRTIRGSLKRFVSIAVICALGVTMLSGLSVACIDLRESADELFDAQKLFDISVQSTLGLTSADIDALASVDGVELVEGAWQESAYTRIDGARHTVDIKALVPSGTNDPYVLEGTLPKRANEVAVTQQYLKDSGKSIGDTVTFEGAEDEEKSTSAGTDSATDSTDSAASVDDESFSLDEEESTEVFDRRTYTITASVIDPTNITQPDGPVAFRASTSADYSFYVIEDAVLDTSVFTVAYLRVEGAHDTSSYSDEYTAAVDEVKARVDDITPQRERARAEEIKADATEEIDDAEREAEEEFEKAEDELADAQDTLDESLAEALEGQRELDTERADALAQLDEAQATINENAALLAEGRAELARQEQSAWAQIDDAQAQIDEGRAELASGMVELREQEQQAADGQAKIDAGYAELADGQAELDAGRAQAEAGVAAAQDGIAQADAGAQALLGQLGSSEAEAAWENLKAATTEDASADAQAAFATAAEGAVNGKLDELEGARAEAEAGLEQVEGYIQAIDAQLAPLEEQKAAADARIEEIAARTAEIDGRNNEITARLDAINMRMAEIEEIFKNTEQGSVIDPGSGDTGEEPQGPAGPDISALETEYAALAAERDALASERETLEAESEQLDEELTPLTETSATLAAQIAGFQGYRDELLAKKSQAEDVLAQIDAGEQQLEALLASRQINQLASGMGQATVGLAEAQAGLAEVEAGQAEIDENRALLDQNQAELNDGAALLASARAQLESGAAELDAGQAELDAQRAQLPTLLAEGWDEIASGEAELAEGQAELDAQRADALAQLAEAQATIDDALAQIAEGQEELDENRETFDKEKADALAEIADARAEVDDIEPATWYVQDRNNLGGYASVDADTSSIDAIARVIPVIFFVVAVLVSLTTATRMVEEERTLIGLYKALGYSKRKILSKYVAYTLGAALIGGLVGDVLGLVALPLFLFTIFNVMYRLPILSLHFSALHAFGSVALFVVGIVGATILTCRSDLRETPAALMRPKAPQAGSRIFLEHIAPLWRRMNFLNKVTARNIFRYKKRFFMTVFGILGCTALLICGFAIKDTVSSLSVRQYGSASVGGVTRYDLMAVTQPDDFAEAAELLASEADVTGRLDVRIDTVTVEYDGGKKDLQLYVIPNGESLRSYVDLRTVDGNPIELPDEGIVVTNNVATVLGFDEGDTVGLKDSALNQADARIAGVAENFLGNAAYCTQEAYEKLFGADAFEQNGFLAHLAGNADEQIACADELSTNDLFLSVTATEQLALDFSESFALINSVVYVVIILAAALSFTVVFTLSNTNISERERELATIKVLGFKRPEVHRYINKETLILTGIGVVVGLPVGYALARSLTWILRMPSLYFDVVVDPLTYVVSAVLAFAFTLVVNLITNRSLDRIDMVGALKSAE